MEVVAEEALREGVDLGGEEEDPLEEEEEGLETVVVEGEAEVSDAMYILKKTTLLYLTKGSPCLLIFGQFANPPYPYSIPPHVFDM